MPRILIVDDEEDLEDLILQRFSHKAFLRGYEFSYAANGLEALRAIRELPDIEIALVDINMPEMDGLTFLEKSKKYNPLFQAIIISAYGDMSNIRVAMNKGAFDFLTKPIDMSDLDATIQKTIHHVNELKEKEKIARENRDLKQKTVELQLQALRAQMNPHFIFNSLNSINNFILRNEKEQASEYLIKFSKLIRLILENSRSPLISLEKELEALILYIQLESLRFDNTFQYDIRYSDELDTLSTKVPPLILQPFVENAIHHGLIPKNGPGQLMIDINECEGRLLCTVKDNGIGRDESARLRSHTSHMRHSLGLTVTSERINALSRDASDKPSQFVIYDLVDPNGNADGTEVRIDLKLPQ